ncbi:MAG: hypothetical protein IIY96_02905, partial [Lachnospiraceae bacterium]|nr:hypothetical protein [Lachnospiraceae bacterium]
KTGRRPIALSDDSTLFENSAHAKNDFNTYGASCRTYTYTWLSSYEVSSWLVLLSSAKAGFRLPAYLVFLLLCVRIALFS